MEVEGPAPACAGRSSLSAGRVTAQALVDGENEFKAWERDTPYFEDCMPDPGDGGAGNRYSSPRPNETGRARRSADRPLAYAVVQLRQDNALGTLWNMVGSQTKLKHGEQARIFGAIPGLENAEFARFGGIHRNSFISSPRLLDENLRRAGPNIRFAGQITGCEGYAESAAIGLLAERFTAAELGGERLRPPPVETAMGALLDRIIGGADAETFQPMNVNFGLMPPVGGRAKKADRKVAYTNRARTVFASWLSGIANKHLAPA